MAIRAIIPCAGLGTRMGMKRNQSKELLINPYTKKPLIDFHLKLCKHYNIKPLIILRKEKRDLIAYCKRRKLEYLIVPDHQGEWYDTVLMSKHRWYKKNILMLPDTTYEPRNLLGYLKASKKRVSIATHVVTDVSQWGIIRLHARQSLRCYLITALCEKPNVTDYPGYAWGMIAFDKQYGEYLMNGFKSKKWFIVEEIELFAFNSFYDLTRNKKIIYANS